MDHVAPVVDDVSLGEKLVVKVPRRVGVVAGVRNNVLPWAGNVLGQNGRPGPLSNVTTRSDAFQPDFRVRS